MASRDADAQHPISNRNGHYSFHFNLWKFCCRSWNPLKGNCTLCQGLKGNCSTCQGHGSGHVTDRSCEIGAYMTHLAYHICCQQIISPHVTHQSCDRRVAQGQSIVHARMECAQTKPGQWMMHGSVILLDTHWTQHVGDYGKPTWIWRNKHWVSIKMCSLVMIVRSGNRIQQTAFID